MNFEVTEDQQLLWETTRKFLETTMPTETVRRLADDEALGYEAEWWRKGAELGWVSMLVPEDLGGGSVSGHGLLDLVLVAEEMGRSVAPGPFLPCNVVAEAVARSGSERQRQQVLPALVSGEAVAAWCLSAPAAGLDPGASATVAARSAGQGFVLSGATAPVEAAAGAAWFLVVARSDGGVVQALLPRDTEGLSIVPAHTLDLVRRFDQVRFDDVEVGPEDVLGPVDGAAGDVEAAVRTAVVLQCAALAGALGRVLEFTVEYAFDRYSFGRPLASYQALKHRFADMKLWVEASYATSDAAARAVDEGAENADELVSVAKAYIGERAPGLVQECVQLHGGIGTTWEHDIHLFLRRVLVDRSLIGTPADHRARVAAAIGL
ncbi:MAG: acyl-CoA/acyl-ACP dehydrogenase [Acidimicrobiales bacterium]|nr:acyl-CoA/acyl-ACP dehydrogenase [Acidimicrobiales bacterium]